MTDASPALPSEAPARSVSGEQSHVGEESELLQLADLLSRRHDEQSYCRIIHILEQYQEDGTLLDGFLQKLVEKLMLGGRRVLKEGKGGLEASGCGAKMWRVMYTVMKVRGVKTVGRLMGSGTQDFLEGIEVVHGEGFGGGGKWSWEVVFGVWVWLAGAVLVPFGLNDLVSQEIIEKVTQKASRALESLGRPQEGAVMFLSKILTRPDMKVALRTFVAEAEAVLMGGGQRRNGVLRTLAQIFKIGKRTEVMGFTKRLLPIVVRLLEMTGQAMNQEDRWLAVKVLQRLCLVNLPPTLAPWRYSRGSRLLFGSLETLANSQKSAVTHEAGQSCSRPFLGIGFTGNDYEAREMTYPADGEGLEEDAQEMLEIVVHILLTHMQHPSTKIRWTTAKSIGRITSRLPHELAADIVNSIFNLLLDDSFARSDSAWHGGLLTLAELARHGAILPQDGQLDSFLEVAARAARYDLRVGGHSVGTNVRDSACYAFWGLARAYAADVISPFADKIAKAMLPLALFDREVNCRRAAAAAYQECVGRTNAFPHGISIVGIVNFFSVSDRVSCYGKLASQVSTVGDGLYREALIEELLQSKLKHWDVEIRKLASMTVARLLSAHESSSSAKIMIARAKFKPGDPAVRHGAVLTLAHLITRDQIGEDIKAEARELPVMLEKNGYIKGGTGDLMQSAVCALISASASSGVYDNNPASARTAFSILAAILASGNEAVQAASTAAISALCESVVKQYSTWSTALSRQFSEGILCTESTDLRRGYAAASGALGFAVADLQIVNALVQALTEDPDVEVRRNAATSLGDLLREPGRGRPEVASVLCALSKSMQDWQIDNRGDVGSWVREASILAAVKIICVENRTLDKPEEAKILESIVKVMLRLGHERLDKIQAIAMKALKQLASARNIAPDTRNHLQFEEVENALRSCGSPPSWRSTVFNIARYWKPAFTGLVSAAGGLGHQSGVAMERVVCFLLFAKDRDFVHRSLQVLLDLMAQERRMVLPVLNVLEHTFAKGSFDTITDEEGQRIVQQTKLSWKGNGRDVKKLGASARLLAELAAKKDQWPETRPTALKAMGILLCGPIPRIRRIAAESFYLLLVGEDDADDHMPSDDEDQAACYSSTTDFTHYRTRKAIRLTLDTPWEFLPATELMRVRKQLLSILEKDASLIPEMSVP